MTHQLRRLGGEYCFSPRLRASASSNNLTLWLRLRRARFICGFEALFQSLEKRFVELACHGVAEESLTRARRNAPGIRFDATVVPTLMDGVPERLARAINNLLDNAARHSPPGGTVEVAF